MARPAAASPEEYLAALDPERQSFVSTLRGVVNEHLPDGYEEGIQYGMIGWYVPLRRYPAGYRGDRSQPLPYVGLASQAKYVSLYLMGLYVGADDAGEAGDVRWFRAAWAATGARLDMGKSCVRMKRPDGVPLDVIGQAVARVPVDVYVARYEAVTLSR